MPQPFANKQVLVTGGTGGIGRAIAESFAQHGARVTVTGRTAEEVAAWSSPSTDITAMQLDVCSAEQIQRVVGSLPSLDCLVNCAGTILRAGREHNPQDFAAVVDVNLNGTMRMCTAFRDRLSESRGCVVNLASMLSFFGSGYVPAYSASKGGIVQLTKSLAIAWADSGVRVNAVAPGWIETPLTRPLIDDAQRNQEIVGRTPLGRWGRPEDVSGAVRFLCSNDAQFITGATLPVDGGYSIA